MARIGYSVLLLSAVLVGVAFDCGHSIWPRPQLVKKTHTFFTIDPVYLHVYIPKIPLLSKAVTRYRQHMFVQDCGLLNSNYKDHYLLGHRHNYELNVNYIGPLSNLTIRVDDKSEELPHMNMNEEYNITISKETQGVIHAKTVWGALRGLETFSQLLEHTGKDQFVIHGFDIYDYPRFSHRGIMIDSSRHFLPLNVIYQTLDAMEYNKFNVLHWHLVDDQSFPYVSETFPHLSNMGAYNPETHVYQHEDVMNVIKYATERGIRVLPEFDTPGHTQSWGKGQPNLLTPCYNNEKKPTGKFGPINPIVDSTYAFIKSLFYEINKTFPDRYAHLGGDEVDFTCWASNPQIQDFMTKNKYAKNYAKLEEIYITKLLNIVEQMNMSYIVWQEVFDNNVVIKNDTIVHVWKSGMNWQKEMKKITSSGYKALLSSCWYLNYISYGEDWPNYYQCDPHGFDATEKEKKLVLGGEACMWGEYVDGSNLISRTWPRASAVAERLWSDESVKDVSNARGRLHQQQCRMQKLGLRVEPAGGPNFCQCDYAF